MRDDLKLFAGGDLRSARNGWGAATRSALVGALDAAALQRGRRVETVCCEAAHALDGPFTSGPIARQSFERVLPNTLVEPTAADHYSAEEPARPLVPDRHPTSMPPAML